MSQCIETPLFTQEVPDKGAGNGHVRFTLKSRSAEDVGLVGFCANVTASLLFERMQAQGTNIILQLTKEQATIDVLARTENDGIHLMWEGKQTDAAALNDIQERIKNKTFFIGKEKKPKTESPLPEAKSAAKPPEEKSAPPPPKESMTDAEEDYLIKQLHRIP